MPGKRKNCAVPDCRVLYALQQPLHRYHETDERTSRKLLSESSHRPRLKGLLNSFPFIVHNFLGSGLYIQVLLHTRNIRVRTQSSTPKCCHQRIRSRWNCWNEEIRWRNALARCELSRGSDFFPFSPLPSSFESLLHRTKRRVIKRTDAQYKGRAASEKAVVFFQSRIKN